VLDPDSTLVKLHRPFGFNLACDFAGTTSAYYSLELAQRGHFIAGQLVVVLLFEVSLHNYSHLSLTIILIPLLMN